MAERELEIAGLLGDQMADEHEDGKRGAPAKRGGRFVQSAFPGGPRPSLVRFGAKPSGLHDDRLSTKAAPGPRGPDAKTLIEEAKKRRAAARAEDRSR